MGVGTPPPIRHLPKLRALRSTRHGAAGPPEEDHLPLFDDLRSASLTNMLYPFSTPNEIEQCLGDSTYLRFPFWKLFWVSLSANTYFGWSVMFPLKPRRICLRLNLSPASTCRCRWWGAAISLRTTAINLKVIGTYVVKLGSVLLVYKRNVMIMKIWSGWLQ